jgi:hypothetical protein
MHKVEWEPYSRFQGRPSKVDKVDGKWVRENLDSDFTMGGHWLVYSYVPKNQVWIERMRNPEEDKYNLGHELDEVHDMQENDEPYHPAHESAKEREFGVVRKSQNVDKELEVSLSKFVPDEEIEKKPDYVPEPKVRQRVPKQRKSAIISDNKNYYLGHETRQPELVASL